MTHSVGHTPRKRALQRPRITTTNNCIPVSISFPPDLLKRAMEKVDQDPEATLSSYIRRLMRKDLQAA